MMSRLRQETADLHRQVEKQVSLETLTDLPRYEVLLRAFFGFYAGVEPPLFASIGSDLLIPDQRRKTSWLQKDLQALGLSLEAIADLPRCSDMGLTSEARAWGTTYVLEGATLGGGLIAAHLEKTLGIDPLNGIRFFTNYGDNRGMMWRSFGEQLCGFADKTGTGDEIVSGARDTFKMFDHWLASQC